MTAPSSQEPQRYRLLRTVLDAKLRDSAPEHQPALLTGPDPLEVEEDRAATDHALIEIAERRRDVLLALDHLRRASTALRVALAKTEVGPKLTGGNGRHG